MVTSALAVRFTRGQKTQHPPSILYEETATSRRAGAEITRCISCARAGLSFAACVRMLMLDRYLVAGGRAVDLATGATVRWRVRRSSSSAMPPLFTIRGRAWLIDFDVRGSSRVEVWEDGSADARRRQRRGRACLSCRIVGRQRRPARVRSTWPQPPRRRGLVRTACSRAKHGWRASCRWPPTRSAPCSRKPAGGFRRG